MRGSWAHAASVLLVGVALATGGAPAALAQEGPAPVDQETFEATQQIVDAMLDDSYADSLSAYWNATFPTFSDEPYHDPQGGTYPYVTGDASGGACASGGEDAAQNAVYCGDDESITYDLLWLAGQAATHGIAGPITVMAHEWGHHIQELAGSPEISKQAELQADCYAGMYLRFLAEGEILVADDVTAMLQVVYEIGDDPRIFDAWTDPYVHGMPEERRQAAGIGFSTGDGSYCVAYGAMAGRAGRGAVRRQLRAPGAVRRSRAHGGRLVRDRAAQRPGPGVRGRVPGRHHRGGRARHGPHGHLPRRGRLGAVRDAARLDRGLRVGDRQRCPAHVREHVRGWVRRRVAQRRCCSTPMAPASCSWPSDVTRRTPSSVSPRRSRGSTP